MSFRRHFVDALAKRLWMLDRTGKETARRSSGMEVDSLARATGRNSKTTDFEAKESGPETEMDFVGTEGTQEPTYLHPCGCRTPSSGAPQAAPWPPRSVVDTAPAESGTPGRVCRGCKIAFGRAGSSTPREDPERLSWG